MNEDLMGALVALFVLIIFLLGLGGGFVWGRAEAETHAEIVKHGCAEYGTTKGKWQWKK